MNVIFIAAGSGSRLGGLTEKQPKPLVQINGKSILERQISILKENGINDLTVVVGPNQDKFNLKNIKLLHDVDHLDHDQLGSLMVASDKINDETLILFADIVFDEIILQQMLNTKCDIGIAIDLDWEKSYEERMDNPKADADKVLLSEGKIKKLSKKIQFENNELKVGEFNYNRNVSRFFNERYLPKLDLKTSKKNFHSLRHTVSDHLKQKGIEPHFINELLGHATGNIDLERYWKGYNPDILYNKCVKKIVYETSNARGIDFKSLKVDWNKIINE